MDPFRAIGRCFRNYANFNGRGRRSEFWPFYFFGMIAGPLAALAIALLGVFLATNVLGTDVDGSGSYTSDELNGPVMVSGFVLAGLAYVALLIPVLAAWSRRLHDMGQTSGWLFLCVIGFSIVPFIMAFFPSEPVPNRYGQVPEGIRPLAAPGQFAPTAA
ncbi:DUF805 domain-containing protein [Demequina sp. B12]|uniref:DUF805 domain-containing protein n=1 Tax=Demequina sp. B12 TaxID=2992757 RepID=UPI00237B95AE|nr:DUF805 domain-containing protein [Demequina sp. B12]MDE0572143.1 DUF805 domain-containing protein [Demequina sp. B12]